MMRTALEQSMQKVSRLQTELRAARAKARALAEDGVELQLRFARKSAEAKEHNGKRMWLEKKLSAQTLRLQLLEDGVKALQSARKMMMAEKRGLSTELGRTKLKLAGAEMATDLEKMRVTLVEDKFRHLEQDMDSLASVVERGSIALAALGPGQDGRVMELKVRLGDATTEYNKAIHSREDRDLEETKTLGEKDSEQREEVLRMTTALQEQEQIGVEADKAEIDPAEALLKDAEPRLAAEVEQEEMSESERARLLREGMWEVDLQRQLLGWAGVGLDEDAVALLGPSRENDFADRAVASLLLVQRRALAYQLQDVECAKCRQVKVKNLAPYCHKCAGPFALRIKKESVVESLRSFNNIAHYHEMPWLAEIAAFYQRGL